MVTCPLEHTYRFRIPGWGQVEWKRLITELSMIGYTGSLSYEHEDVTMSRMDGVEKTAEFLKPLIIKNPYEGRKDKLYRNVVCVGESLESLLTKQEQNAKNLFKEIER